jgi:tetratricopeptide (TPR) repeat protein
VDAPAVNAPPQGTTPAAPEVPVTKTTKPPPTPAEAKPAASAKPPTPKAAEGGKAKTGSRSTDLAAAYQDLEKQLGALPSHAIVQQNELRLELAGVAFRLGRIKDARGWAESVLAHDPGNSAMLELLLQIYRSEEDWDRLAGAYERLAQMADRPQRKAELLFQSGEALRHTNLGKANDVFLKAADLHPTHAPTLRRLVSYYYSEGDFDALAEIVSELEAISAPFSEASLEAGFGLAMSGQDARGTVILTVARPSAAEAVATLGRARIASLDQLDAALRTAVRALGGPEGQRAMHDALREAMIADPTNLSYRLAAGRLRDLEGSLPIARLHYSVVAFVDPGGAIAERLNELGAPVPLRLPPETLVHPLALGPLRDALRALAPFTVGFPSRHLRSQPAPDWDALVRPIAQSVGVEVFTCGTAAELDEPAWVESSNPLRLVVAKRILSNERLVRFAAHRAFHAFRAGLVLLEGREEADLQAMLRAAAKLILPDVHLEGAGIPAWAAELSALGLRPESIPVAQRDELELVLTSCILTPQALDFSAYSAFERSSANRAALAATGDLEAALNALVDDANSVEERIAALDDPEIQELLAFTALLG